MKFFLPLFLVLFLSGCILQSKEPNFGEADGMALLGPAGGTYVPSGLEHGVWQAEDPVKFAAVGKHYAYVVKSKTTTVLFVPIRGAWWVAQFREDDGPSYYMLANKQPDAIYIHPLACEKLKPTAWARKHAAFEKDDCFLRTQISAQDFNSLIAAAGPRVSKLVLQK